MASSDKIQKAIVGEGVKCPHCNSGYCPVRHTETREIAFQGKKHSIIRRKRVCQHCNLPFTTTESPESEKVLGLPAIVETFAEQLQAIKESNPGRSGILSPKKTPPPVKNPYLDD